MAKEKRNPHTYKCTDKVYKEAMKRAKKEKKTLAKLIEDFVIEYGKTELDMELYRLINKGK